MDTSLAQSTILRLQSEIERLQRRLTDETRKEADRTGRISRAAQSARRTSSETTLRSKQRELERLERELVAIQKKKADLTKKIARKTGDLHRAQQKLMKEQERERTDLVRRLEQQESASRQRTLRKVTANLRGAQDERVHDAFVSHASEDKEEVVAPLAALLRDRGFDIWYDEFELEVGDSLRRKIDTGLASARFGIVVLSPSFFAKNWPQYELDGLVAKEIEGSKVILPVWHRVSKNDVIEYSPTLADRLGLSTANYTVEELADRLAQALRRSER